MADNLTQITDVLNTLNATFDAINTTDILANAIQYNNTQTEGWLGIFIFIIFSLSVAIFFDKNKGGFNIGNRFTQSLITLNVIIDLGVYLLIYGILESLQIFIWVYTLYFVLSTVSFLKKEVESPDK